MFSMHNHWGFVYSPCGIDCARSLVMGKHILVTEGQWQADGQSQESLLCDRHLADAMKRQGLSAGEYVIDADDDLLCDECDC